MFTSIHGRSECHVSGICHKFRAGKSAFLIKVEKLQFPIEIHCIYYIASKNFAAEPILRDAR